MGFGFLNKKGQVSIEFILILTFGLVYITAFVWPVVEDSSQAAFDVKAVSDTKVSALKLANALDQAALSSGDMRKSIKIFLPRDSKLECNTTEGSEGIEFSAFVSTIGGSWNPDQDNCSAIEDPPGTVVGFECVSKVPILADAAAELDNGGGCPMMAGPIFRNLVVEKSGSGTTVSWG